jgi:hypothetical protein
MDSLDRIKLHLPGLLRLQLLPVLRRVRNARVPLLRQLVMSSWSPQGPKKQKQSQVLLPTHPSALLHDESLKHSQLAQNQHLHQSSELLEKPLKSAGQCHESVLLRLML